MVKLLMYERTYVSRYTYNGYLSFGACQVHGRGLRSLFAAAGHKGTVVGTAPATGRYTAELGFGSSSGTLLSCNQGAMEYYHISILVTSHFCKHCFRQVRFKLFLVKSLVPFLILPHFATPKRKKP